MSPFWGILIGLAVVGILFKLFRKTMLAIVGALALILLLCILWPQLLVVVADLVVRIRDVIGLT